MFTIKICGITTVEDARMVAEAGADAIGLNFYPASPRYVSPAMARAIVDALPAGIVKVGLLVDVDAATACERFDDLGLDLLQLHGDEPPALLGALGGRPAMKAFRLGPNGLAPVVQYLQACRQLGCLPRFVLLDSFAPGVYGGTGKPTDWSAAAQYRSDSTNPPLVLAGGLSPQNVAAAIRATGARAVDVASGVESAPGRKDPAAVAALVRAARDAFAA